MVQRRRFSRLERNRAAKGCTNPPQGQARSSSPPRPLPTNPRSGAGRSRTDALGQGRHSASHPARNASCVYRRSCSATTVTSDHKEHCDPVRLNSIHNLIDVVKPGRGAQDGPTKRI